MYSNVGVNLRKELDQISKRIKIPVIKSKRYSKDTYYNCECNPNLAHMYHNNDNDDYYCDYDECCNEEDTMCCIKNFICENKKMIIEVATVMMAVVMIPVIVKKIID